jgi:hypothetical protein
MALEDAVVLASSLRAEPDLERALRGYEDARRARAAFVQERSWWLGRIFQWEHPLLCWIRDRASASTFGRREAEELFRTFLVHRLAELPWPASPVSTALETKGGIESTWQHRGAALRPVSRFWLNARS